MCLNIQDTYCFFHAYAIRKHTIIHSIDRSHIFVALPDNAKKVKEFKDLIVNQLPKPNYYTLKALLEHLLR